MGYGADALKYRFQWSFPIAFSPHDPKTLYIGANVLLKTTNEGQSWELISPDLTRNDKPKTGLVGRPHHAGQHLRGVLRHHLHLHGIAGDQGPDLGGHGRRPGADHARWRQELGQRDAQGHARMEPDQLHRRFAVRRRHRLRGGDRVQAGRFPSVPVTRPPTTARPGRRSSTAFPTTTFTRVVREDPNHRGLLVAGTEFGLFISFDDGENWKPFQLNLPVMPITDLAFQKREQELVVATQGRAFYVLDDVPLLYQLNDTVDDRGCAPVPAQRHVPRGRRARVRRRPRTGGDGRESAGGRGDSLLAEGPAAGRRDDRVSGRRRQAREQVFQPGAGKAGRAAIGGRGRGRESVPRSAARASFRCSRA